MEHDEVEFTHEGSNQDLNFSEDLKTFLSEKTFCLIKQVKKLTAKGSQNTHFLLIGDSEQKFILRKGLTERPVKEYLRLKDLELKTTVSPKPFLMDNSKKFLDSPYLVMEFIKGTTKRLGEKIEKETLSLAAQSLKRIHSIPIDDLVERDHFKIWESWSGENVVSDENFQSVQNCPHSFYREYYKEIVTKTQHLKPLIQSQPLRLVHGDAHLGNMRVTPNGEIRLLDWELTHIGCFVMDLGTFIVESVLKPEQVDYFLESYGYETHDPKKMAVLWWWRMFRSASILSYLVSFEPELDKITSSPWLGKYKDQIDFLLENIPSI